MPVIDAIDDLPERTKRLGGLVLAVLAGFMLLDAFVIHPRIWENQPALGYWLAKPVYVGVPMAAAAWWLVRREDARPSTALLVGGLAGIVSLQLYYTVVPIPMVDGTAVQIGVVGNLTEGLIVHYGGLAVALAVVLAYLRYVD